MHMLRILGRAAVVAISTGWLLAPGAAAAATNTYTCVASSFTATGGTSGNLTISCTDPGTTSTSCTLSPASSVVGSSGTTLTLNGMNCGTLSGWTATSGATVTGGATSASVTVPANAGTSPVTYTVSATNSTTPTSVSATVTVSAPSAPPPVTGAIDCSSTGYKTLAVPISWGAIGSGNVRVTTKGFTNGMIAVAYFTTPNVVSPTTWPTKISSAEASSQTGPVLRTAAFSDTPCVFPTPNPIGSSATIVGSTSPSLGYLVNGTSTYYPVLKPNTTYYFNIKNEYKGASTCKYSACDMYVEIAKPSGW